MSQTWKRKPPTVEVEIWDGTRGELERIAQWIQLREGLVYFDVTDRLYFAVETISGDKEVTEGDAVVVDPDGRWFILSNTELNKIYEL